jgi:hypothetical protein
MASEFESERDQAAHITGDYYWYDETRPLWWAVAAVLSITLPPVGVFLVAFFAVRAVHREESLDSGPEAAVRPLD